MKERILDLSLHEFKAKGIKAVKMDDIARMLSISKRTLYEIYSNKEQLLQAGVEYQSELFDARIRKYSMEHEHNVMDVIVEFYRIQMQYNADVNPLFFSELHKYPGVIAFLADKHSEREQKSQEFFQRGIEEGYFRADINYEIVMFVGKSIMRDVMEGQLYRKYPMKEILHNILFVFIRGFCTHKGIEIVDSLIPE